MSGPLTPTPRSDVTLADVPPPVVPIGPPPLPVPRGRFAWLADKLADQPTWVQVAVTVALLLLGAMTDWTCTRPKPEPQPTPAPVVVPVVVPAEQPRQVGAGWAQAPAAEPVTARQRLAGEHFRRLASRELQRNGFALVGGDPKPLAEAAADKLVEKLTDGVIAENAKAARVFEQVGEGGGLLGFLQRLAQWVRDHPEQVQAILKILLTILLAFGEPTAVAAEVLPDGSVLVAAWYDWGSVVCLA